MFEMRGSLLHWLSHTSVDHYQGTGCRVPSSSCQVVLMPAVAYCQAYGPGQRSDPNRGDGHPGFGKIEISRHIGELENQAVHTHKRRIGTYLTAKWVNLRPWLARRIRGSVDTVMLGAIAAKRPSVTMAWFPSLTCFSGLLS